MKDAEFEAQVARIKALIDPWVKPLGLGWWSITIQYDDDPLAFRDAWDDRVPETAVARTRADWRYAEASIRWNVQRLVATEFSDKELELIFVHELMHIFVNEMRYDWPNDTDHDMNHEERVCTTLAKAFIWLRDSLKDSS